MTITKISDRCLLVVFSTLFYMTMVTAARYVPFRISDSANSVILSKIFSEEDGGYSGRMSGPVAGIKCFGHYCDNKQLISVQRGGQTAVQFTNYFTNWFSDEGSQNFGACPQNQVLVEIQCRGHYCDEMRLHCAAMASGYRVVRSDIRTVRYFSEEQGEGRCPDGYYIYRVACQGMFCDNIELRCARVDIFL